MNYGRMPMAVVAAVVSLFLLVAGQAGAQDCEVCDDHDWTQVECVPAEWDEMGSTDCAEPSGQVGECPPQFLNCWGDDSFQQLVHALASQPEGTRQELASLVEPSLLALLDSVPSPAAGTVCPAWVRLHDRNP